MARKGPVVCEPTSGPGAAPLGTSGGGGTGVGPAGADCAPASDLFSSAEIPTPTERPLKVYAFDPSAGRFVGNYMTALVRYEKLKPGPVGERFAVIDYDGANRTFYKPIDFNDQRLLVSGGLAPSQSDPRFHQQMVYAVAMETLQRFEYALGRRIRWRGGKRTSRLNLFPHAMREANAFYSRAAHGILFGYFKAARTGQGRNLPGQTVFTCLSHDIIAHETTHAIVDSIREFFMEPTNVDVPAFHEAFADLAALFSHFAHKEALLDTLQKTGGRLFDFRLRPDVGVPDATGAAGATPGAAGAAGDEDKPVIQAQIPADNPLIALATQFGEASGRRGGLRSALGTKPNADDIAHKTEAHERGAILVAAVFDAYFTVYARRTSELFRIFRAGGRTVDQADLPLPLASRLADEASRTADEFFVICARALDYCPPVDITFGDFLRAVLTAHLDVHPLDPDFVRDAFMQAFRLRGIFPDGAAAFSEESLFWPKVRRPRDGGPPEVVGLVFGDPNGLTRKEKDINGDVLRKYAEANARVLGFDPTAGTILAPSFHPMFHMGQDGRLFVQMVVELVQEVRCPFDARSTGTFPMRNGATLLISQDPSDGEERPAPRIRFIIAKTQGREREERIRTFYTASGRATDDPEAKDAHFQMHLGLLHTEI
jgi:hypothetical protein